MSTPSSPRSLLTPRWVASHLVVLLVVAVLASLGAWQLRRLEQVRGTNDRLEQRLGAAPLPALPDVAAGDEAAIDDLEFRQVAVTGTFDPTGEVLLRSRSRNGVNGYHVVTPLRLEAGPTVLVLRGWVPFGMDTPPVPDALPPQGPVTVQGFLEKSAEPPRFGARDPDEGRLERMFRADVPRIGQQLGTELFPMVLHLESQRPAQPGRLPSPAPRPEFDETRHVSYALQWFSFAVIALVAYGAFLRRRPPVAAVEKTF